MDTKTTRGIRNNNPLNIRISSSPWRGKVVPSSEKEFETFCAMEYGIRAAIKTIRTYVTKHGCNTMSDIIRRWAPPTENKTTAYINAVYMESGIYQDDEINIYDRNQMGNLIKAMALIESRYHMTTSMFDKAWDLL